MALRGDYRGFVGTIEIRKAKGTVVVFHGNAGTADHRAYYVTALGSMGYRVILAEYPGYGARQGELGEPSFVRDAQATVRLASQRYAEPIFLLGESLGCGVVAAAARDESLKHRCPHSHHPLGFALGCGKISVPPVARRFIFERQI